MSHSASAATSSTSSTSPATPHPAQLSAPAALIRSTSTSITTSTSHYPSFVESTGTESDHNLSKKNLLSPSKIMFPVMVCFLYSYAFCTAEFSQNFLRISSDFFRFFQIFLINFSDFSQNFRQNFHQKFHQNFLQKKVSPTLHPEPDKKLGYTRTICDRS